jgi:hypothetical protein
MAGKEGCRQDWWRSVGRCEAAAVSMLGFWGAATTSSGDIAAYRSFGCGGGQDPVARRAGPEGQRRSEEGEVESSRSGGGE